MLSPVTEMIIKIRNEREQKTNEIRVNNTEFHCNENISSYSDAKDTNKNCHDGSDSEFD